MKDRKDRAHTPLAPCNRLPALPHRQREFTIRRSGARCIFLPLDDSSFQRNDVARHREHRIVLILQRRIMQHAVVRPSRKPESRFERFEKRNRCIVLSLKKKRNDA